MKTSFKIFITLTIVALAATAWLALRDPSPGATGPRAWLRQRLAPSADGVSQGAARTDNAKPISLQDANAPHDPLAQLKAQKLEELARFHVLSERALPSADERRELQRILSDSSLIRRTFLMMEGAPADPKDLPNNQEMRILGIDYLSKAAKWKDNPARDEVFQSLKSFIVLDNLGDADDKAVQKSLAGDKVEAYVTLRHYAPELAEQLRQTPPDSRLGRVVRFAESQYRFNTNQEAREQKLRNKNSKTASERNPS